MIRILAAALLLGLSTGARAATGDLAVTLDARPLAGSCAVASTATVVAYDAGASHAVTYRFVHGDGTITPPGRLWVGGDGTVAQSVSDVWTPKGTARWVVFEILAPEHIRSRQIPVTVRCAHAAIAAAR